MYKGLITKRKKLLFALKFDFPVSEHQQVFHFPQILSKAEKSFKPLYVIENLPICHQFVVLSGFDLLMFRRCLSSWPPAMLDSRKSC